MLIQLPNGDWIDPATVIGIVSDHWERGESGSRYKSRAVVYGSRQNPTVIPCDNAAAAQSTRDAIAAAVNAALG